MEWFVEEDSVVREIWGKGDTVLFIFAGAAAEFALNKAVDWLYFTGRVPADPLGRLLSTVAYARKILFANAAEAHQTIAHIRGIHSQVEKNRGQAIPDWAYRDVLYMLIDYSMRAFELLERKLTDKEKQEIFASFHRLGTLMGLRDLPADLPAWYQSREVHLAQNLESGFYTRDLFQQYRKHLGWLPFQVLKQMQIMVAPGRVRHLLSLGRYPVIWPVLLVYKWSRRYYLAAYIKSLFLPPAYKAQLQALDRASG
jgi:ER-bound oxygenase mpaB/B'/Rubber oxygenase, catalytic domain